MLLEMEKLYFLFFKKKEKPYKKKLNITYIL